MSDKEIFSVRSLEGIQKGRIEKWADMLTSDDIREVLTFPLLDELEIVGEFQPGIDFTPLRACKNLRKLQIIAFTENHHHIHVHGYALPGGRLVLGRNDIVDINITQLDNLQLDELEIYADPISAALVRFHLPECGYRCLTMSPLVVTLQNIESLFKRKGPLMIRIRGPPKFDFFIENDKELIDELFIDLSRTTIFRKGDVLKVSLAIDLRRYNGLDCLEEIIFELGVHGDQIILMPHFFPRLRRLALVKPSQYPEKISVDIPGNFRYPLLGELKLWKSTNEGILTDSHLVKTLGLREFGYQEELRARLLEKYGNERMNVRDDDYREWVKSLEYIYFRPSSS